MKDSFVYDSEALQEVKGNNVNVIINGIHVSSSGYYGFQPIPQHRQNNQKDQNAEYMDVQVNDSDIQFNNFIDPEANQRLGSLQTPAFERVLFSGNRKRQFEDAQTQEPNFKKRREQEHGAVYCQGSYVQTLYTVDNLTSQLSNSKDEELEEMLKQTHGSILHHWLNAELL